MSFDFYDALRDAVDGAAEAGMTKGRIIYDLKSMIEEVEGADDIPEDTPNAD